MLTVFFRLQNSSSGLSGVFNRASIRFEAVFVSIEYGAPLKDFKGMLVLLGLKTGRFKYGYIILTDSQADDGVHRA